MGFAYPIDSKVVTNPNGTIDYDRASSSTQLRGLIKSMITNGVNLTESTNLQVMADEETMNLVVKPGYVIIEGALKHFEDDAKVTIGVADTNNPRIDTVVARLNLNEDVRDIVIDVLQGTPSAEPTAPELTRTTSYYEVGLADILVELGTTQISQAVVTDTRLLNSRCGLATAIGEIDTETLFVQLTNDFNNWFEGIKGQLGDDVAGNLQTQINDHTTSTVSSEEGVHGLRFYNDTLEVKGENGEFKDTAPNKIDKVNPTFTGIAVNGSLNEVDNLTGMVIGDGNNIYCDDFDLYTFSNLASNTFLDKSQTLFMVSNSSVTVTDDYGYISTASFTVNGDIDGTVNRCNALAGKDVALVVNDKVYFTKLLGESIYYVTGYGTYYYNVITRVQKTQEMRDNITSNPSDVMVYYYSQHTTEDAIINAIKNTYIYGSNNKISGNNSYILGSNNRSYGNQLVIGHYNNVKTTTAGVSSGTSDGTAFCIGNGTESAVSNALRVNYNGTIYAKSSTVSTGADYSEYFEWADGNEENEDRVGYFVTFDDKQKIRKANATDDYILGIVSGLPCIIGNGDECWKGRYIYDEFGRFIEETFEYEEIVDGKSVIKTGTKYKENPEYDSNQEYIERAKRKEWSAVGMIGVLSVYDDGTCQENGYCTVSDGGIATACKYSSAKAYRVLERVTDNIIKVLFK